MDTVPAEVLLSDWRWLVPANHKPVVMTALGDLFLHDKEGRIHFLDLMCGELNQIANSSEEFDSHCENKEKRLNWFASHLVMELRKLHGDLASGQCFSCKVPLSLGGQMEIANFQPCDVQVHYSVLGQLHQQTRHLPLGTKIDSVTIGPAHEPEPKRIWQRVRGWMG